MGKTCERDMMIFLIAVVIYFARIKYARVLMEYKGKSSSLLETVFSTLVALWRITKYKVNLINMLSYLC